MRYFLPGAFFFSYLFILILPQVQLSSLNISIEQLVGIFGGIIVASPIVGYIIYASFDDVYGEYIQKIKKRGALTYIEQETKIKDFRKKKMLLHLLYHSTINDNAKVKIDMQILQTIKNYLNNFTSRMVSGVFTPIFAVIAGTILIMYEPFASNIGISLNHNWSAFGITLTAIAIASALIAAGSYRVLKEAYQLEEYLIKTKKAEIEVLKEKLHTEDQNKKEK